MSSTFVVMSRKKHVLNVAASSELSGGVSRVFTAPANGTFVINASAQRGLMASEPDAGSIFIQRVFRISVNEFYRKLTSIPLATASVQMDAATTAETFQFVERMIVSSEGRFTDGPAM